MDNGTLMVIGRWVAVALAALMVFMGFGEVEQMIARVLSRLDDVMGQVVACQREVALESNSLLGEVRGSRADVQKLQAQIETALREINKKIDKLDERLGGLEFYFENFQRD